MSDKNFSFPLTDRNKQVMAAGSEIGAILSITPNGMQARCAQKIRSMLYTGFKSPENLAITNIPMILSLVKHEDVEEMIFVWDPKQNRGNGGYSYIKIGNSKIPLAAPRQATDLDDDYLAMFEDHTQEFILPEETLSVILTMTKTIQAHNVVIDCSTNGDVLFRATDVSHEESQTTSWTSQKYPIEGVLKPAEDFQFVADSQDFRLMLGEYKVSTNFIHACFEYNSLSQEELEAGVDLRFFISASEHMGAM